MATGNHHHHDSSIGHAELFTALQKHHERCVIEEGMFSSEVKLFSPSGSIYHIQNDGAMCDCPREHGVCSHLAYYRYLETVEGDPIEATPDFEDVFNPEMFDDETSEEADDDFVRDGGSTAETTFSSGDSVDDGVKDTLTDGGLELDSDDSSESAVDTMSMAEKLGGD